MSDELAVKLGLHILALQQIVAIVTMPDDRLTQFQANLKEAVEGAISGQQSAE